MSYLTKAVKHKPNKTTFMMIKVATSGRIQEQSVLGINIVIFPKCPLFFIQQ